MSKPFDLVFASLGNGITVFDKNRQEHNDYKIIAHIKKDRSISWNMTKLPSDVKNKIVRYSRIANPSISASQSEKVFDKNTGLGLM
jgi:hypothetical protein